MGNTREEKFQTNSCLYKDQVNAVFTGVLILVEENLENPVATEVVIEEQRLNLESKSTLGESESCGIRALT